MEVSVTLSANAGVALHIGGRRIWVDALHDEKQPGFSAVDLKLQRQMLVSEAFARPDYILYTHCHGDHYSQRLTDAAVKLHPDAKVIAPEGKYAGAGDAIEDGELSIRFIRLPHEGEQYADVIHFGLIIRSGDCSILIPGDCAIAAEELIKAVAGCRFDLVLLNFPWASLRRGREFVLRHFADAHILLYHLPFEADDINAYRAAVAAAAKAFPETVDVRLLMEPLQTENYQI